MAAASHHSLLGLGSVMVLSCLLAAPPAGAGEDPDSIDLGEALRQLREMAGSRPERSWRRSDHALDGLVVVRREREAPSISRHRCLVSGSFRMLPVTAAHTNWGVERPAKSTVAASSRNPRGSEWSRTTGSGFVPVGVALDQYGATYELTVNVSYLDARQVVHHGRGNITDMPSAQCAMTVRLTDLSATGERLFAGRADYGDGIEVAWSFGPASAAACTPDASPWARSGRRAGAADAAAEQLRSSLAAALAERGFTAGTELVTVEHADETTSLFHLRLGSGALPLPAAEFVIEQALAGVIPPGAGSETAAVLHGYVERAEGRVEVEVFLAAAASGELLASGQASATGNGDNALGQAMNEALAASGLAATQAALAALGVPTDPPPPPCTS
jgi:hypothetical protein